MILCTDHAKRTMTGARKLGRLPFDPASGQLPDERRVFFWSAAVGPEKLHLCYQYVVWTEHVHEPTKNIEPPSNPLHSKEYVIKIIGQPLNHPAIPSIRRNKNNWPAQPSPKRQMRKLILMTDPDARAIKSAHLSTSISSLKTHASSAKPAPALLGEKTTLRTRSTSLGSGENKRPRWELNTADVETLNFGKRPKSLRIIWKIL